MSHFHRRRKHAACVLAFTCAMLLVLAGYSIMPVASSAAGDTEYMGTLSGELIPYTEDMDQVVFRPVRDLSKIKFATPLNAGDKVAAGRLYHPLLDKSAILALLVEPEGGAPFLYADVDLNGTMSDNERFELKRSEENNPYILETTLSLPMTSKLFQTYPLVVQYFKDIRWDEMKEGERLILQSKEAFAKGTVDIQGRKTLVEYSFNAQSKKINPLSGWVAVDGDGNGQIELDRFSPEAAEARDETVVFRVGEHYVSTKRVDVEKNQIVMREHPASDYKRVELRVGSEVPDFPFTDLSGKKHKLSDFRGKYVLLDFWAAWCGPCRRELPYQKAAYSRFQDRGLEILGMNNDDNPSMVKEWLKKNGLAWPQATMDSIKDVELRYRIHLFPTTLLLGPDGKIVLLDKKGQPRLRGEDLLKTLDQLLPP